jgi:hypothetical protein
MERKNRNVASLVGGAMLILFGGLALLSQIIGGFDFWNDFWPLVIAGFGLVFFVGMFAGGKSAAPLAIPGSIITGIGLMMLVQNLTNHWESWSYGWTVILISVGLGIFIMGIWNGETRQRQSGLRVMGIGVTLFIIFGTFFEMIFNSSRIAQLGFPVLLILLGAYLIVSRAGLLNRSTAEEISVEATDESEEN